MSVIFGLVVGVFFVLVGASLVTLLRSISPRYRLKNRADYIDLALLVALGAMLVVEVARGHIGLQNVNYVGVVIGIIVGAWLWWRLANFFNLPFEGSNIFDK